VIRDDMHRSGDGEEPDDRGNVIRHQLAHRAAERGIRTPGRIAGKGIHGAVEEPLGQPKLAAQAEHGDGAHQAGAGRAEQHHGRERG